MKGVSPTAEDREVWTWGTGGWLGTPGGRGLGAAMGSLMPGVPFR